MRLSDPARKLVRRAGIALALLGMAPPATAQITFLKCTFQWQSSTGSGQEVVYWGFDAAGVFQWWPQTGLIAACDPKAVFIPKGGRCTARVTDSAILRDVIESHCQSHVVIDRLSGTYRDNSTYSSSTGTCARTADPRTAPRAF